MNFLNVMKSELIFYLYIIAVFLIANLLSKRQTFQFMMLMLLLLVSPMLFITTYWVLTLVIILMFFAITAVLRYQFFYINYKKPFASISLLSNALKNNSDLRSDTDKRFLGKILPYSKYQIKHNMRLIGQDDAITRGHTIITGSTGSGKTYAMKSYVEQDVKNGHSVCYFCFKGDYETVEDLRDIANKYNVKFYEMSAFDINFNYDPLKNLNKAGKVEALMNMRKWSIDGSDAHYRTSLQVLLQKLVNEFDEIYDGKSNYLISFYNFVLKYKYPSSSYDAYTTLIKLIEIILTSNIKTSFYNGYSADFSFDLNEQYLVVFSFISSNKELGNSIASFVFKDIIDTGTNNSFYPTMDLYVDETGSLENAFLIKDILEKGRSCGIAVTFGLQDINQIEISTNAAYLRSLLGTINNFLIFNGATKETAQKMADVQIAEIDKILMSLKKPYRGEKPTAMYISKYPTVEKDKPIDVFKVYPFIYSEFNKNKDDKMDKGIKNISRETYNEDGINTSYFSNTNSNINSYGDDGFIEVNKDASEIISDIDNDMFEDVSNYEDDSDKDIDYGNFI